MAGQAFSAARLLGIVAAPTVVAAGVSPTEHYVRSTDLIVAYEEFEGPVRVDCLWRATEPATDDRFLAAIDLVISVRARTLDSHPELAVASVVPASEALRLQGVEPDGWKPQRMPTGAPLAIMPDDGPGCLLFRLPGAELSYAEMVHPADFRYDEVARDESGGDLARIAHRLFQTHLEKGVILRGRVRGIFLPRDGDTEIAARCYAAFAGADPPLDA